MKQILTIVLLLTTGSAMMAQEQSEIEGHLQADVVSNYIWRGLDLGHVSLQPELSVEWKGLSLSAWGSVGLTNHKDDKREIDLTLSYETGGLSFGVVDYWTDENDKRYFYYKKDDTGHAFEAFVAYDFGPVNVAWQTFFVGSDLQESGKRAYSSFFQVGAPFQWATCDWEAQAGVVPWLSDYYSVRKFSVTYLSLRATKNIRITDTFSLPLFGQLVANPQSNHLYFVAGFSLNAF